MTRTSSATARLSVDVYGQQHSIPIYQRAPSSSVLAPTRMIDYSTPPGTQSRATSVSGPSTPATPQGLGILSCPFPSSLIDAFSTCSSLSSLAGGDWSVPVSMSGHSSEENSRLDLFPMAPSALSSASMGAAALYTSSTFSSSSVPTPCTDIDFAFVQQQGTIMPQDHFQQAGCSYIKQEEDGESWFNDHIDLEGSQGELEPLSSRQMKSQSLSPAYATNARLVSPPRIGFGAFSQFSDGHGQQGGAAPVSRSESVESCRILLPVTDKRSSKGRRHSGNFDRRYVCSVCNRACDKKYNLREHEKIHDPTRVSQFLCPRAGCGKRLGRKTDVKRHVQSVHDKEKKFACDKCSKRFDRKDTLSR